MAYNPAFKGLDSTYFEGEYVYNFGGFVPKYPVIQTSQNPTPTPTPTPSQTLPVTPTATATPTNTASPTNTATQTPTRTPTQTPTRTPTQTPTTTLTATPTNTPTQTQTGTPPNTPTNTTTPSPTPSQPAIYEWYTTLSGFTTDNLACANGRLCERVLYSRDSVLSSNIPRTTFYTDAALTIPFNPGVDDDFALSLNCAGPWFRGRIFPNGTLFSVGNCPTPTPTSSQTPTPTPTNTSTPTNTPTQTPSNSVVYNYYSMENCCAPFDNIVVGIVASVLVNQDAGVIYNGDPYVLIGSSSAPAVALYSATIENICNSYPC